MALRTRKIGKHHKLTVPTHRKGMGVAQAAKQVAKSKSLPVGTAAQPGAGFGGDMMAIGGKVGPNYPMAFMHNPTYNGSNWAPRYDEGGEVEDHDHDDKDDYGKGGSIHINPKNKGKFNALKKRTGKSTEQLTHSSNPLTRKRAIFAQNARKWHHKEEGGMVNEQDFIQDMMEKAVGGWVQEYAQGGRTINPAMGGYMIGGQHAYPPLAPYPPMYGFGGVLQGIAPFASLIPGVGSMVSGAMNIAGGMLEKSANDKNQEALLMEQRQRQAANVGQSGITGNARPTFSWGGRLPETMEPMSPSGLTMGHVPGYDSNSNYGGTNVPGKGWNYRMVKGDNEGTNWQRETNMNVRRHTYPEGGAVGKAVTTVRNNRFIPLTERQFYDQAIKPNNDTLSWDQFNQLPPTLDARSKYLPNSDYQIQQGKRGTTMNKGYLKYLQNNPVDMGTDITRDGLPVFRQPDKSIIKDMFPQATSQYPMGGQINDNLDIQNPMQPVELEKQEVYQTPSGQMGQVNGPSHAQGGVDMALPENSFVWSDKLKTAKGTTFADEAARLGKMKAKYEKILKA